MEVKIKVPDALAADANARGLRLETYIEELLARRVSESVHREPQLTGPIEIRAWLDSLTQFSDKIPPLPDQISRQWIYQDHD